MIIWPSRLASNIQPSRFWVQIYDTFKVKGRTITFKTGDKVLHSGVIKEKLEVEQIWASRPNKMRFLFFPHVIKGYLSLVVDVVKVLSDTRLRTLALDVLSGCPGAVGASGPAAQSQEPQRQHGPTEAPGGEYVP